MPDKFELKSELKGETNSKYWDYTLVVKQALDFETMSLYIFTLHAIVSIFINNNKKNI